MATASLLEQAPVGVVALGPPSEYGVSAAAADSAYDGPLLVLASTDDSSVPVADSRLVARPDDPATFVELSGAAHGLDLFAGEHTAEVEARIDAFLASSFGAA